MIAAHLPALQVVVPLMAAPLCVVLRRPGLAWALAVAVSWFAFAVALALLGQVLADGPISYPLGDWAAPWGIEYRIDLINGFVLVIVAAIGAVIAPFSAATVAHEIPRERVYLFYAMYLLCLTGLLGMTITGDVFNIFVFLEISSLSTYVLVSLGPAPRALTASYRYLIMGTLGATFYVIGIGLLYMMTGSLNMADLAEILPAVATTRTVLAAVAFLTAGIALKAALFPLHLWLPNAYAYAPSAATAFLAATATKVSVYILIRFFFTIFGDSGLTDSPFVRDALAALALLGVFVASTVAIYQENAKRLLAYSSIAQIGYMILGISFVTATGLGAAVIHLFNHALTKGALFMALAGIALRVGSVRLRDMAGLGRRMPWTMAAFTLAGLSLIGIPLTVGFVSKWYLVAAALEERNWLIAALVLISSLLALIYVWRVVEVAYFRPAPENAPPIAEAPLSMLIPTWIMVAAAIWFGLDASFTAGVALDIAGELLGAAR